MLFYNTVLYIHALAGVLNLYPTYIDNRISESNDPSSFETDGAPRRREGRDSVTSVRRPAVRLRRRSGILGFKMQALKSALKCRPNCNRIVSCAAHTLCTIRPQIVDRPGDRSKAGSAGPWFYPELLLPHRTKLLSYQ